MSTITVELTEEMAIQMLPIWERQRAQKEAELKEITDKICHITATIKSEGSGTGSLLATVAEYAPLITRASKTPQGKNKRGESEKLIYQFLGSVNGGGASTRQIIEGTGTVYGTALRVLKILKKSGKVKKRRGKRGLWMIVNGI